MIALSGSQPTPPVATKPTARLVILLWIGLTALSSQAASQRSPLAPGRFGRGLEAQEARPLTAAQEAYAHPPLTVECWALLRSKDAFNLLVANEAKASGSHWEIYSYAGSGFFSVYLPGYAPAEIKSTRTITDGQWHYLALVFEPDRARLYVDGSEAANQQIKREDKLPRQPGALTFGTAAASYDLRCDGLIDEVRLSQERA